MGSRAYAQKIQAEVAEAGMAVQKEILLVLNLLNLPIFQFQRGGSAEIVVMDADGSLVDNHFVHFTLEVHEGAVGHLDLSPFLKAVSGGEGFLLALGGFEHLCLRPWGTWEDGLGRWSRGSRRRRPSP